MPTTDDLIDCSIEGRSAFRSGDPRSDCPHPFGTPDRRYWLMGWDMEEKSSLHPVMAGVFLAHGMVSAPPVEVEE